MIRGEGGICLLWGINCRIEIPMRAMLLIFTPAVHYVNAINTKCDYEFRTTQMRNDIEGEREREEEREGECKIKRNK